MEPLFLLVLLPVALSVNHSLTYFVTLSTGFQDVPEFAGVAMMDGLPLAHCRRGNSSEQQPDWLRKLAADNPKLAHWNDRICTLKRNTSRRLLEEIQLRRNQTGGAHVLQEMSGCQLDAEAKATTLYDTFGYDGHDFMTLDVKNNWTWVYTENASVFAGGPGRLASEPDYVSDVYLDLCPEMLKKYLKYRNSSLQNQDPPSVSLLQTSPSSPVSCYATGFYPNRPRMFWRKDGEQLQEHEEGEVLPNQDGTFQVRVDLNVSSIRAEDWSRYDCVFHLAGLKDVVTKLDRAAIRTSSNKPSKTSVAAVTVLVVLLVLVLGAAAGFRLYRNKAAPDSGSELYERLTTDL